ncbi:hypothetical protein [Pedobacter sp. NJ-S-72]
MNLPRRAEDAHATLAAAYNTGDVATVMNMYDTTGIIVPEPGKKLFLVKINLKNPSKPFYRSKVKWKLRQSIVYKQEILLLEDPNGILQMAMK